MTPRAIRRAAERRALKESRKSVAAPVQAPRPEPVATASLALASLSAPASLPVPPRFLSDARLTANRANAQLSTGPITEEGKRTASLNAVKSALTGQTVLLPTDDVAHYEALVASLTQQHNPRTDAERRLVQSLADTHWRLRRIPALENAIFARGRVEFADRFSGFGPELVMQMVDSETVVVYEKQLRNLQTQEGRLRRQREKDLAELKALQAPAETNAQAEIDAPAESRPASEIAPLRTAKPHTKSPAAFPSAPAAPAGGFEFATALVPPPTPSEPSRTALGSAA